jgi:hypothetical protein
MIIQDHLVCAPCLILRVRLRMSRVGGSAQEQAAHRHEDHGPHRLVGDITIRQLVDKVVLTPAADAEGSKRLTIDLHGHLAGILSLATKAKRPLGESGFFVESIKLVAGAGFETAALKL